jgi:hypothetical protein
LKNLLSHVGGSASGSNDVVGMEELRKRTYDSSNGDQFPMGQSVAQDDSTEMKYSRIHHSETLLLMAVLMMYLEVVVCAHASSTDRSSASLARGVIIF